MCGLYAIALGKSFLYVNTPMLLDDLRPNDTDEGKKWMKWCMDADVLFLDDLGKERTSDWVMERLYLIVNQRYMERKATIFTANLSIDKLGEKMKDPAILSRLKHLSAVIDFRGDDKRV